MLVRFGRKAQSSGQNTAKLGRAFGFDRDRVRRTPAKANTETCMDEVIWITVKMEDQNTMDRLSFSQITGNRFIRSIFRYFFFVAVEHKHYRLIDVRSTYRSFFAKKKLPKIVSAF